MKPAINIKKKRPVLFFWGLILAGLVLLLAAALSVVICFGFQTHSDAGITTRITELIKQSGVDSCSIKRTRFTPWRGLEVDSLYITTLVNNELYVKSTIDTLGIRYDIKTVLKYVYRYRKSILHSAFSGDFTIIPDNKMMLVSEILPLIDTIHAKGENVEFTNRITNETCTINKFVLNTQSSGWINPQRKGSIESEVIQYGKWSVHSAVTELLLSGDSICVKIRRAPFLKGHLALDGWIGISPLRIKKITIAGDSLSID